MDGVFRFDFTGPIFAFNTHMHATRPANLDHRLHQFAVITQVRTAARGYILKYVHAVEITQQSPW